MISFAQNAEDVLIQRFFDGDPAQNYVDVGAAHPVVHSVTKHFYDHGWSGLNIEPRQEQFNALCADRPRDITLPCCVSNKAGVLPFFEVEVGPSAECTDNGGLSTVDASLAEDYRTRGFSVHEYRRDVLTLNEILERYNIDSIGFLKIDVEGHEPQVVAGLNWQRWRPRLVILESTIPLSSQLTDQQATHLIESQGYTLAFFDGLNQFLVRNEDRDRLPRLSTPANVFDAFVPHQHLIQIAERDAEIQRLQHELNYLNAKSQNRLWVWQRLFPRRQAA